MTHVTRRKLRVGVVFGGRSCEHDISLNSGSAVLANLDASKYDVVPIGIAADGTWHAGLGPDELRAGEQAGDRREGGPSGDLAAVLDAGLDLVIPVLHGPYGEDGTIQGLFEMADIPYVGCGVLGSALGMDKEKTKSIVQSMDIPVIDWLACWRIRWEREPAAVVAQVERQIGYPCVVKPANMGSSVGVSRAGNGDGLAAAVAEAMEYDSKVVVERCLNVRELACGVLGNEEPDASLIGEYVVHEPTFLDYTAKYLNPPFRFDTPADIPPALACELARLSREIFVALDLSGLARVDFFKDRDGGGYYFNEVNTMPGFSQVSVYPKLWAASGLPYPRLLDRMIELALARHEERARMRSTRNGS